MARESVVQPQTPEAHAARERRLIVPGIEGCRTQRDADELTAFHLGGYRAGGGARSAPPGAGLVRLETSVPDPRRPTCEETRIEDAKRRYLRLFKSISCAGDLHRLATDQNGRRLSGWFVTFTYRADVEWEPGQISAMVRRMRRWAEKRGAALRFVWVAEQHKSGRIHYHAIVFLPHGMKLPFPDRMKWWPWGMTERQPLRKHSVGYLIKYATKCRDISRPWPKGCRLHGHGGLEQWERERRAWWVLPKYIREQCEDEDLVRRRVGGGWVSPVTGEVWPSYGRDSVGEVASGSPDRLPVFWWVYKDRLNAPERGGSLLQ